MIYFTQIEADTAEEFVAAMTGQVPGASKKDKITNRLAFQMLVDRTDALKEELDRFRVAGFDAAYELGRRDGKNIPKTKGEKKDKKIPKANNDTK